MIRYKLNQGKRSTTFAWKEFESLKKIQHYAKHEDDSLKHEVADEKDDNEDEGDKNSLSTSSPFPDS